MLGLVFSGFALGILAADASDVSYVGPLAEHLFSKSSWGMAAAAGAGLRFVAWARGPGRFAQCAVTRFASARTSAARSVPRAALQTWPKRARGRGRRILAWGLVFALSFVAGAARLEQRLDLARRDAAIAQVSSEQASQDVASRIRFVEGRVAQRESRSWGDEIILSSLRAVDAGGAVPARLRLSLDRAGRSDRTRTDATAAPREASRADQLLWPGTVARLGVRIKPLRSARNPGSEDRERAAARRGLGAHARLVDPDWVVAIDGPTQGRLLARLRGRGHRWRMAWYDRVRGVFLETGTSAGFARAIAMGDRSGLDPELLGAVRRLGLAHLIAVSGLHVSIVAGGVGWLATHLFVRLSARLGLGRRWPRLPFLASLLSAWMAASLYGWASGAGVSIQRAVLLFGVFALFRLGKRVADPTQALVGVAGVLLVFDPGVLFELGARLSFLACAGMIWAGFWQGEGAASALDDQGQGLRGARQALSQSFQVSLAVSFATAPVLFAAGLVVPSLAPVWNVLAIPWTGLVALPASIAAVLGVEVLPREALGLLLWPTEVFESCAMALGGVEMPFEPLDRLPGPGVLVLSALGLGLIRGHRPGRALLVWVVVAGLGSAPALHGRPSASPPRVVFFDVGQGDAALIQGRESTVLVDTGGGRDDGRAGQGLIRGLRALGADRLDVLVVTHGDLDHRAGAARILSELRVAELWLPAGAERDPPLATLARRAQAAGSRVRWLAKSQDPLIRGDLQVEVLWPPERGAVRQTRNDGSLVLAVRVGGARVLMAADIGGQIEARLLEEPGLLRADGLKVGHHGSRQSSTPAFLEAVSPGWAVVSAPCDAARGLPNDHVLDRLESRGIEFAWTGRDGAVFFGAGGRRESSSLRGWGRARRCRGA